MMENREHLDLNDNENTKCQNLWDAANKFRGKSLALNAYSRNKKKKDLKINEPRTHIMK